MQGEMPVSTQARVKLEAIVNRKIEDGSNDTLPVSQVRDKLARELDIEESTVDNYIRWYCVIENISGERHIISMKEGETTDKASTASQSFAPFPDSEGESDDSPGLTETDVEFHEETDVIHLPVGARTGEDFEGLPVLEDVGHPLVPNVRHTYFRRDQIGETTDMENICDFLTDPDFSVLLVGEHGTGKDFAILTACARTNRPVRRVNFGAGTTYEDLVGLYAPKPEADDKIVEEVRKLHEKHSDTLSLSDAVQIVTGAASQFSYQIGVLTECVLNGGTFLGDEINASGGDATMPLHGITEAEGSRYLHLKPSNKVLTDLPVTDEEAEQYGSAHAARVAKWDNEKHYGDYIHPEFKFVGTMNPLTYGGTKPLNDAFKSRFWPVTIDYLEAKAEKQLLFETTPMDPDNPEHQRAAEKLTKIAANLRQSYKDMDIVTPIGHREMIKIGKLSPRMGPKDAAKYVLTNIAQDEDKSAIADAIEMEKF